MRKGESVSRKATQTVQLRLGDCVEHMRTLPPESVGGIVCDPPYG